MRSNSRRHELLASASYIVEHLGMEKLTLESVAKHAGVSKGGLLHHFPNKEAIVTAMIEEFGDTFFSELQQKSSESIDKAGKWSRAYIETTFHDSKTTAALSTALLAVLFSKPELLAAYNKKNNILQEDILNDGIDPVNAAIIKLATDGLWFSEIFGVRILDQDIRNQVEERLMKMSFEAK